MVRSRVYGILAGYEDHRPVASSRGQVAAALPGEIVATVLRGNNRSRGSRCRGPRSVHPKKIG
jgi:hypothetical protein